MEQAKAKRSIFKKWWFWLVVVIILAIIGLSGGLEEDDTVNIDGPSDSQQEDLAPEAGEQLTEEAENVTEVNIGDLLAAFDENQIAAEATYAGQKLKITGVVSSIGIDIADRPYIVLTEFYDEYAINGVQCYFGDDQKEALEHLQEGDEITLVGVNDGKVIHVSMKDCRILQ